MRPDLAIQVRRNQLLLKTWIGRSGRGGRSRWRWKIGAVDELEHLAAAVRIVELTRPLGEPANVAEDIEKTAPYPIEREPGVAVDELVVVHKPVEGMTFRFYGVVADSLKPIVADLDVSIARFTVG